MNNKRKKNWTNIVIIMLLLVMVLVIPVSAADAPTVNGAATNQAGTIITIAFNKTMADPSGKQAQFKYNIGGGVDQSFSAAALMNTDPTKIELTTSGTAIAHGDTVTVSYTAGDVVDGDGEFLATFPSQAVTNNVPAAGPTFTSITPTSGPIAGGTAVSIVGTNFVSGGSFGVTIGGANAAGVYVNATHITAVTPAHAAGAVNVVITNNDGQTATGTNAYTYAAGPTFTSITPTSGPTTGGTPVTISGSNFVPGGSFGVTIGGANAAGVYVNATHITAVTPAHAAGAVNVVITNNDGQNVTGTNAYTYAAGPTFTSITPTSGPTTGGTPVTISGSNFVNGGSFGVTIGGTNATGVYVNATHITAVTPAHSAGAVNVVITNNDGQTATGTGAFTYVAAPVVIFSGTPTSGPKPLNVAFTDSSTGIVSSYSWNFGDGNTSNIQNPSHLYTTAGSYTVNLTVTGPGGSNLESKTNYITVTNATTKIGIYKDGVWYLDLNGNGGKSASSDKAYGFGAPGWINVTGDWNNDGKTDIGVTNGQQWYLDMNNNGAWDASIDKAYNFGAPGWIPIIGDWSATGSSYIGVTNGQQWYLDWNGNGAWDPGTDVAYTFGAPGWTPIVGDWSVTGSSYIGVTNGQQWYLDWNGNGAWDSSTDKAYGFGAPGWSSVVGDWNPAVPGTKIGVYQNGVWYLDWNGNGAWDSSTDKAYGFGAPEWSSVVGDWNGEGKSKIGVYKDGTWYLDYNGDGAYSEGVNTAYTFLGIAGWKPVVGDWNGTGTTKIGVYKEGDLWYLDWNGNGVWDAGTDNYFNIPTGDYPIPVIGDWNGDGKTKVGSYRKGYWSLDYSGGGAYSAYYTTFIFDGEYDTLSKPVVGDWNGKGKSKMGAYKYLTGVWYLDYDGNGVWNATADKVYNIGVGTPVVGDWNGDGRSKIGVYTTNGDWYLDYDGNGVAKKYNNIGLGEPRVGDWNGDGRSKIGVYTTNGDWYLDYDGNGVWDATTDKVYNIGVGTPVVGKWS